MINTLKIKETEERKVYITSDTHFNHDREFIWGVRGYLNNQDHTDSIINDINSLVRPNDILIHCGDFCLNTTREMLDVLLDRINCQNIYYIWGNHNNPLQKVYNERCSLLNLGKEEPGVSNTEVYPIRYKNLVFMGNYMEAFINGRAFVFCHYPIYVWNNMKDGVIHCCGHSHYSLPFSQAEDLTAKILDVGWDGFKQPYSPKEIESIAAKKGLLKVDHHQKKG